jgi:hypothetical protein
MYSDRVRPMTGDKLMGRIGVILAAWEKGDVPAEQAHNDLRTLLERAGRSRPTEPVLGA